MIAHVFFELLGVLADPQRLYEEYPAHLGAVMAAHYGQMPEIWAEAYCQVRRDWDSYWSDLDLKGDEPLVDLWEGMFRTTRALFRLAGVDEPDKEELITFSRIVPGLINERFDALYPTARRLIVGLYTVGVSLHVATHWTVKTARGLLVGGNVLAYFTQPIWGMDVTGSFERDYSFLALKVGALPHQCLVVDCESTALERAHDLGMRTLFTEGGKGLDVLLRNGFQPLQTFEER